ncbi:MAG: hypothetical protein AAB664_01225, partial [Patescibacteria group bacterium]
VEQAIRVCAIDSTSKAKALLAVIGCGFGGIVGAFLIGMILLILGGYVIMSLSKSKTKPWFLLHTNDQEETEEEPKNEEAIDAHLIRASKSKFF